MLPRHDDISPLRQVVEGTAIAVSIVLLIGEMIRVGNALEIRIGWIVLAAGGGLLSADLVSGLVHWTADTWGSETMPVLGRRFLHPFRVHHVNPDDFLRRRFLDTNGDVAMIVIPILLTTHLVSLASLWGQAFSVFIVAFSAAGLPTNQVHQWAHMRDPPRIVRWLQNRGIILSREAHRRHHEAPYAINYCIATGWCNSCLTRIRFFRRLERMVSATTGLVPRQDDTDFQSHLAAVDVSHPVHLEKDYVRPR